MCRAPRLFEPNIMGENQNNVPYGDNSDATRMGSQDNDADEATVIRQRNAAANQYPAPDPRYGANAGYGNYPPSPYTPTPASHPAAARSGNTKILVIAAVAVVVLFGGLALAGALGYYIYTRSATTNNNATPAAQASPRPSASPSSNSAARTAESPAVGSSPSNNSDRTSSRSGDGENGNASSASGRGRNSESGDEDGSLEGGGAGRGANERRSDNPRGDNNARREIDRARQRVEEEFRTLPDDPFLD